MTVENFNKMGQMIFDFNELNRIDFFQQVIRSVCTLPLLKLGSSHFTLDHNGRKGKDRDINKSGKIPPTVKVTYES